VGNYASATTVSITDTCSGTTICFGWKHTYNSSTQYSGPIAVNSAVTLKAIAAGTADLASTVSEADYSVTATPTISLSSGKYSADHTVTLSDSTAGAAIYQREPIPLP
jgi:hypothetical protein